MSSFSQVTKLSASSRPAARGRRARERAVALALCLPAFGIVFGLLAYPLFYDLWLSFTDASHFESTGNFVGLANYQRMVADPLFWIAARNTAIVVLITAWVELLVGVLTALLLWWRFWGRALVFLAVFIPWAYPSSFSAFAWYWLMLPPFHSFYTEPALTARFWMEDHFGLGAWQVLSICVMNVWRGSSIIAVLVLAGLNAIPEELIDYARLETRDTRRLFIRAVAPLARRFLVLAALVAAVITYMDISAIYIQTGGRITFLFLGTLAYQSSISVGNSGYGAALIMAQVPIAMALAAIGLRYVEPRRAAPAGFANSFLHPQRQAGAHRTQVLHTRVRTNSAHRRQRRWLVAAGVLLALLVMVFHLFPIYYTAIQAIRPIEEFHLGQIFWAFHPSPEGITDALGNATYWQWSRNTLVVYAGVLVAGLTASMLAGYSLARLSLPGALWAARLMFCAYFIPQAAVFVPLFRVYSAVGLDNSIVGIVLLYLTMTVPFATWLFFIYFAGLDREVEEQARLDGTRVKVFLRVVLPMSWPVVVAAGLFSLGMIGSDVLYAGVFTLSNSTKTLPAGLGVTAINLDEWANVNAAILLASLPLLVACAALGRHFVHGLRAALVEGA